MHARGSPVDIVMGLRMAPFGPKELRYNLYNIVRIKNSQGSHLSYNVGQIMFLICKEVSHIYNGKHSFTHNPVILVQISVRS